MITVEEFGVLLEEKIPASLREAWDHDGAMVVPNRNEPVTRVLCALDCTSEAIAYAKAQGCNVIVTHHPLLFHPLPALTAEDSVGKRVLACVQAGIAVFSFHTRLDCMEGGVNDCLASLLELQNCTPFLPYGRIGDAPDLLREFDVFSAFVGMKAGISPFPAVKARESVQRVAVVAGSGKGVLPAVLAAGADTLVTGEVPHDHLIDCKELGLNLLCVTHEASERPVLPFLCELVGACGAKALLYQKE